MESLAAGGDPPATELTLLADLDREDLQQCRTHWASLAAESRERLISRCGELAEENIDLDFTQLARMALDDPEAAVRRVAIAALWESGDRHVGARLADLLRDDPDESVRGQAASELSRFVLAREFDSIDATLGDRIVECLRAAVADPIESVDVRASALESLGSRSLPWVETLIIDAYYEDDRRLHFAAIRAMGHSAQERWLEYLEDEAQSEDPELRYEVASAIGEIASEEGVDILAAMLEDDTVEVRAAALASLGEIGGDEALRILREFAEDASEELQLIARTAIKTATFLMDEGGPEPF